MRKIISKNPFTGQIRKSFDFLTKEQLSKKLDKAQEAFKIQSQRTLQQRANLIAKLGECIQERQKEIAEAITFDMGKPIIQAQGQVKKAIIFCQYYSKNFELLKPHSVKTQAKKKSVVKYLPLGGIYFLVPFNFPFFLNFKGGLPNLLLGNVLLTRNADSCASVGQLMQELMNKAGFNNGQYQNLYTSHDQIDQIFENQLVGGVSFTGSSKSGAIIAEKAGKHLKKSVMQLGGNDPFIVLVDADLDMAVEAALRGRCFNAGQVCFSPKRFIIAQELYDSFKHKLIEGLKTVKFGDPMKTDTKMGPLARDDLHDNLNKQLQSLPTSYKIIFQRTQMKKPFFPITVIEGSDQTWDEELFGPIYQLFKANSEDHAIKLANSGSYGLASSVFSIKRGEQVIDRVRAGMGFVNEVPKSDYSFPSGGVGRSGYGRQCGDQGLRQFANIKIHYVN